jgi:hypothetical protein
MKWVPRTKHVSVPISERSVQAYKKGKDQPSSRFQKGDEIREKSYHAKLHHLYPGDQKQLSSVGYRGEKRGWAGSFSKSNQTIYSRVFSPPQALDQWIFGHSPFSQERVFNQSL